MKFTTGHDFENAPAGSHAAVCTKVIDIGTQPGKFGPKRILRIFWELAEKMKSGEPYLVMEKYTMSLHKKSNFRGVVESWSGVKLTEPQIEKFTPKVLLGKTCLLSLVENGEYVNIASIMKLPKEIPAPTPKGELVFFDLDNFDAQVYSKFSEKTKLTISQTPEYKEIMGAGMADDSAEDTSAGGAHDDDIPF